MASKTNTILKTQSGAALVVALIMLVVITLIALASSYTSIFEIKISGNKRGATNAFYAADAGVNAITAYSSNFQVMVANTTNTTLYPFSDASIPSIPNPTNASVIYYPNQSGPPRGGGYSAVNVAYAYYLVQCTASDTAGSGASSQIREDVIRLLPAP